jgi:hypothetical protein
LLLPSLAYAQASIAGTVRDSSGAVLPGVTVEAASDVLIEKVRVTVADGNGRYQLIDLRPGSYVVTFTLTGFNSFRRSGVMLTGANTAIVDAEMRIGALEETITVTGEAPVVDVSTTTRQSVLSADTIDALPTARNYVTLARLIPGTQGGGNDVGGSSPQGTGGSVTIHGSKNTDQRVTLNGINTMTLQAGGNIGGQIPDVGSAAEITVDTTSLSADLPTGGVRINFVPKDGGNRFANSTFFTFSNESLQGSNYTDELRNAGLATPNAINYNWDLNQSFGGPMKRDKVWFWFSVRRNRISNYAAVFENVNAFNPNEWTYVASDKRGQNESRTINSSLRVTWQASPKHKIAGTYKVDRWCQCPDGISATRSPETATEFRFPRLRQEHLEWTSPMTNRILVEAVGMHLFERWGRMHLQPAGSLKDEAKVAIQNQLISVTEQSTGMTYRTFTNFNNTEVPNFAYRAAMSYVTGTHNFKVGFNRTHGFLDVNNYSLRPISYRFNNGVPNQITLRANPVRQKSDLNNDLGLFAQDRITLNRMTLGVAIRYDYFKTSFPDQTLGPAELTPNRNATFEGFQHLGWHDLSYRSSMSYDVFGNGRTAVKFAANKYLLGQTLNGIGASGNPIGNLVNQTTRNWTDSDVDFVPDCDLTNPLANGECQAMSNSNFGTVVPGATFDEDLLRGFGTRPSNWEFSASVQHEVLPRVSVDVGFYRRIWQNFSVTDNLAVDASDFDTFDVRVPNDPRLPNANQLLTGLRNLKPTSFGRPSQNYNTKAEKFGRQQEHWNGVDVAVNARLQNGLTMQIGTSTGRTTTDNCEVRAALPELSLTEPRSRCREADPFQTDIKGYAVYTVPRVDVQVSGTFRSTAPSSYNASFTMNNAYLAANSTLGRPLAGGGNANISVDLLEPNSVFGERRNEVDLRFGKVVRIGTRARSVVSIDLYNALNNNAVLDRNETFTLTGSWPRPTSILNARLVKFSVQFDF